MPIATSPTSTKWTSEFDTARREKLFKNPPTDHTPYPALLDAIQPHIHSFNSLLHNSKLLEAGIRDIGTKVFLDGEQETQQQRVQRLEEGRPRGEEIVLVSDYEKSS